MTDLEDQGFDCKISKLYASPMAVNIIKTTANGIFLPENQTLYFNAHLRIENFTGTANEFENFESSVSPDVLFGLKGYNISIQKNGVLIADDRTQMSNIESRICQMIININSSRQAFGAVYYRREPLRNIPYKLFIMFGLIVQSPIPITSA